MDERAVEILYVGRSEEEPKNIRQILRDERILATFTVLKNSAEALRYLRKEAECSNAVQPDLIVIEREDEERGSVSLYRELQADPRLSETPVAFSVPGLGVSETTDLAATILSRPATADHLRALLKSVPGLWYTLVKYPEREEHIYPSGRYRPRSSRERAPGKPLQLLYIEDNPGDLDLMREALAQEATSLSLETASRLEEGLAKIKTLKPDLILLDLSLPDSQEYDTFRRANEAAPHLPIIIVTIHEDLELALRAVRGGAQDYLFKGELTPHLLSRVIFYAIERKSAQREQLDILERELEARKEAERAAWALDEFLSVASHELKNPISALKMLAHLALKKTRQTRRRPDTAEPIEELLERLEANVERLVRHVDNLLDMSRSRFGAMTLSLEQFNLAETAQTLVRNIQDQCAVVGNQVTIKLDTDPQVVGIWDRSRLEQVLTNLLTNAVKYGSGNPVQVTLQQHHDRVVLIVKDQGIGISHEDQGRVFERFERATSPTGAGAGSLGLGLYIVREVVRRHGGKIWVESEPGKGSAFFVELPLRVASELAYAS